MYIMYSRNRCTCIARNYIIWIGVHSIDGINYHVYIQCHENKTTNVPCHLQKVVSAQLGLGGPATSTVDLRHQRCL